ncbi:hypothetical protein ACP70R_004366 [Stipagrostis hirtigluma subsp. patula]
MNPALRRTRRAVRLGRRLCSSSSAAAASDPEAWDGRFRLHRPRGQHLLTNPRVLDEIVRRAGIRPGDAVLEVGPGTGNLTVRLLASPAATVAAVEIDRRMVDAVTARAADLGLAHKLTVITGDAIDVELPEFDVCVSNIPYCISSPLIAKLLFGRYRFRTATLLLQREFARRLAAAPGDREYNRLAANARLVADVRLLMDVSKREFVPVPIVDSSLVEIRLKETRPTEAAPGVSLDEWLEFLRVCFEQHQHQRQKKKTKKEKTLGTIFKQREMVMELLRRSPRAEGCHGKDGSVVVGLGALDDDDDVHDHENDDDDHCFSKEEIVAFKERVAGTLQSAGLVDMRPSRLSNDELLRLLRLFNKRGVRFQSCNILSPCL